MKFCKKFEVGSHDVDVNDNIKPSLIQRYMMDTAHEQMRMRRPSAKDMLEARKAFIMTRITIEVTDNLHAYDEIEGQTWCCGEKAATFLRCFNICRGGEVVARAESMWALIDMDTGKVCRPSEIDISAYEYGDLLEMNLPVRFKLPKDLEFETVGKKKVLYSEVDTNMHLNNTYYADVLWSYIPDVTHKQITGINLHFHHEAALGCEMEIQMAQKSENEYCFKTYVDGRLNVEAILGVKEL